MSASVESGKAVLWQKPRFAYMCVCNYANCRGQRPTLSTNGTQVQLLPLFSLISTIPVTLPRVQFPAAAGPEWKSAPQRYAACIFMPPKARNWAKTTECNKIREQKIKMEHGK